MNNILNELPKNVYDRLEYLEFMLRFRGWVSRADLTERFEIGEAAATRDLRLYKGFAEKNLKLNQTNKKYEIQEDSFTPIFELPISSALSKLRTAKITEAINVSEFNGISCPPRLAFPKIDFLAKITRAISGAKQLKIKYRSVDNGLSEKILQPHAIFDNGIHWYVRAYDVTASENPFRSYALTRIENIEILENNDVYVLQGGGNMDFQWNRMVNLVFVPHPNRKNVKNPETIEYDFNMEEGCLKLTVRAAIAGFWLHYWNIDCTEDHSLKGYEYQLWLKNHQTLYDVESRIIAPGLSTYPTDK
ncbi:WYL domain-containing protein [Cocleimonas sp. KMM 6892]|uniref:helix-turn-helix transcriptional regulator n=1 Tax=unclassified Cocleimonas TaxID=2639732 RepID=UPI002DB99D47|nr:MULTISPECIES: WYL domain-containing protein [unclassified Cocleimonas]MEB8430754.1 WYL domain-containing protein [Cocleimonas sp. KMM 6892]MEC4714474.1 WYL domain-containing protein [Cocleimonas sp. KMM 6895]MEC4743807.1 WYL domain-containing protein [Cocleimonas sp. KMM 6896]